MFASSDACVRAACVSVHKKSAGVAGTLAHACTHACRVAERIVVTAGKGRLTDFPQGGTAVMGEAC